MKRAICCIILLTIGALAFSENIDQNLSNKKIKIVPTSPNTSSYQPTQISGGTYEDEFDREFEQKLINKSYYKGMIKQRSKRNPKKYHYIKVRRKKDLKKAGVVVDKEYKYGQVYNYVDIKNVHNAEKENVGVVVNKPGRMSKTVNIVDVKNSSFTTKTNTGTKIKGSKAPVNTINQVELENTQIGEQK